MTSLTCITLHINTRVFVTYLKAINSLHEFMPLFIIKTMLYLISSDIYQYQ